MCGDSAISATDVAGGLMDGHFTSTVSSKAEAETRGESWHQLIGLQTSSRMHLFRFGLSSRPARLTIAKSSISRCSFSFQKRSIYERKTGFFAVDRKFTTHD